MKHVRSMDHVGIIVDDLPAATQFFLHLGLEHEGSATVQGDWAGDIIGLQNVHSDVVMLRTPDGSTKIELAQFHSPIDPHNPDAAPANRLGIRHVAFVVDDLTTLLDTLRRNGWNTVGTVYDYKDIYRVCYVRGPSGIIVELAEELDSPPAATRGAAHPTPPQ